MKSRKRRASFYRLCAIKLFALFLIAPVCFACRTTAQDTAQEKPSLEVTYIANEGMLISSGEKRVLIDSLYREGVSGYELVPKVELEKLETAQPPFDKVNLILVSHPHRDHFDPRSAGRHLENNSQAVLASSQQIVEALEKEFANYQKVKSRIRQVMPEGSEVIRLSFDGIDVAFFRLRHGYERNYGVHNLGHIIKIGGKKLLHIGDAETAIENFAKFNLKNEEIDIALMPFWYLLDETGRTIVDEHIKPKHIVALHIPPRDSEKSAQRIKEFYPDAMVCAQPMEKRTY